MGRRPETPLDPLSTEHEGYLPEGGDLESAATRIEHQDDLALQGGAQPRLVIIGGNNRGKEHELHTGDNSIGRGLENDIVLADIAVSRKHTLICEENGQYMVRDLGSGNGTLVNGHRVHSHILQDGDQLELGKTMLRFSAVFMAAAPAPGPVVAAAALSAQAAARITHQPLAAPPGMISAGPMPQPFGADPDTSISHTEGRQRPPSLSPRSKKLLIFGGVTLVVLFGGLFALKAVIGRRRPPAPVQQPKSSPDELAAQHFEEGTKQYRTRNWEAAREHYLKVLAIAPGFDQAKRYADQAAAEISARDALQRAKGAVASKDFTAARKDLAQVPSTSSYAPAARQLQVQLDDQQVQQLLESARLLEDSGDRDGALAKVHEAVKVAPASEPVRTMLERLSSPEGKRPRPRRPTTKAPVGVAAVRHHPRPPVVRATKREPVDDGPPIKASGAGVKAALAHYRKQQWGPAYQVLKGFAETQGGRRKASAAALADTIRRVGQAVLRAQQIQTNNPGQALDYYATAIKEDRKVPGAPQKEWIKGQLLKVARFQATAALASGKYVQSYQAIRKWESNGGRPDAAIKKVLQQLEDKAKELFTKGYTVRSSNAAKARKLWQQVLKMVPPSSTIYQKAYSYLNSSGPRYEDEDED